MNNKILPYTCLFIFALFINVNILIAQDDDKPTPVFGTFKSSRVINVHSTETVPKKHLDFRVTHRFGDLIQDWKISNSWENFFGFENAADILIGFEYGITDKLMLSISRTPGAGTLRQLLHGLVKYRILSQTEDGSMPISMAAVGLATWSTMKKTNFDAFNPSITSFATDANGAKFSNLE